MSGASGSDVDRIEHVPSVSAVREQIGDRDDSDDDDVGPSHYEYVRAGGFDEGDHDEEPAERSGCFLQEGNSLPHDDVQQEELCTADNKSGVDGDDASEEERLAMDKVEALVAMRLRSLEREYESTMSADISQPAPLNGAASAGRLAALAARNPELVARLAAASQRAEAAAAAMSGAIAAGTQTQWENFDFPEDYDELQAADSAAARAASVENGVSPLAAVEEWGQPEAVFGVGVGKEPFEPFDEVPTSAMGDLKPLKLPSLKFLAKIPPGQAQGQPAQSRPARPAVSVPARAVSPLREETRAEIASVMGRVRITPKGSPITEQIVQAALRAAQAKEQSVKKPAQ